MRITSLAVFAAAGAIAFGLGASPASAASLRYRATLTASAETPPTTSAGTGTLGAVYDTVTRQLTWTVTYSGLTGAATMAHFHGPAPEGKAAPVMVPIKGEVTSPINGEAVLTPDQAKALQDGELYFNIHTAANKAGEIRGQLVPASE